MSDKGQILSLLRKSEDLEKTCDQLQSALKELKAHMLCKYCAKEICKTCEDESHNFYHPECYVKMEEEIQAHNNA